jgi:diaminopimelate decarboxylase
MDRPSPLACPTIAGVGVAQLVEAHGSPLYVFSEGSIRSAVREAQRAFRQRYPDVQFAWSYKTNYLRAICTLFHQEGAIAEVVSDFEYDKARSLGVEGCDIIFNGPHKTRPALERAIDEGAKIQVDHFDELRAIEAIAETRERPVDVAIRAQLDSGVRPAWTKFGFDSEGQAAQQAIQHICRNPRLRLIGLHAHVGALILEPEIYAKAARRLLDLAELSRRESGRDIEYLNLGGGFASPGQFHDQTLPAGHSVPSMDDYAEAICQSILDGWPKAHKPPRLYLETGRALIDEAGWLVTTIVARKPRPGVDAVDYLVDAGINLLPMALLHRPNVSPARDVDGPWPERVVYGCLCMNTDVLSNHARLPELGLGDPLVFHPVGAYNVTRSTQFITYRPPVVLITEEGRVELIRQREDLRHVETLERLPDHLARGPIDRRERLT